MAKLSRFELTGTRDMTATLGTLREATQRKILRPAVSKAGRVLRLEAKRMAPRDSGALRRSMTMNVKTYTRTNSVVAVVGPSYKHRETVRRSMWPVDTIRNRVIVQTRTVVAVPRFYAHLVEFGTQPHRIGRTGAGGVQHPGSRGTRFLSRAMDTKRSEMDGIMRREVAIGIEREAARARAKGR